MTDESVWSSSSDDDPAAEAAQEKAGKTMAQVALALLSEVRGQDAFPQRPEAIEQLVGRIRARLPAVDLRVVSNDEWPEDVSGGDASVHISPDPRGCLGLRSRIDDSSAVIGDLYADGEIAEEGVTSGFAPLDFDEPDAQQVAELTRQDREGEMHSAPRSQFTQFVRALPAKPKEGAPFQLTSVEVYDDGLIVRFLIPGGFQWEDDESYPLQLEAAAGLTDRVRQRIDAALAEGHTPVPVFSITDDVGTDYSPVGSSYGGVPVVRGEARFGPGIASEAKRLFIESYAGTVELALVTQ
jgi:hypothetical protein